MSDPRTKLTLVLAGRGWPYFVIMALFISATVLGLVTSWAHPDQSLWLFWLMTQVLPIFYLVLSVLTAVLTPERDSE